MKRKERKEKGYFQVVLPVPAWIVDAVIPHLTADEIRILLYVIRRSWGEGREWAWIAHQHFATGRKIKTDVIDSGVGMTKSRSTKALSSLISAKLIVISGERQYGRARHKRMRPAWFDEIDWVILRSPRRRSVQAVLGERSSTPSGKWAVDEFDPMMMVNAAEQKELFFADAGVTDEEDGTAPLAIEATEALVGGGKYEPEVIKVGRENGLRPIDTVRIVDAVLDAVGKRELADQGGEYGDRALHDAQRVAAAIIGLGFTTSDDVVAILDYWRGTFQGKSAAKEILNRMPKDFTGDPTPLVKPQFGNLVWAATSYKEIRQAMGKRTPGQPAERQDIAIEESFVIPMISREG